MKIIAFVFLATASDTDSDLEDGAGPNVRDMDHVRRKVFRC